MTRALSLILGLLMLCAAHLPARPSGLKRRADAWKIAVWRLPSFWRSPPLRPPHTAASPSGRLLPLPIAPPEASGPSFDRTITHCPASRSARTKIAEG